MCGNALEVCGTICSDSHGTPHAVAVTGELKFKAMLNWQGSKGNNVVTEENCSFGLNAMHGHDVHVVVLKEMV